MPDLDAGEERVAPDVVQVVDREHAGQQRLEQPHPGGHRRVDERRLRDEERDPARVDRLAVGEGVALRGRARRSPERPDQVAELALDDQLAEVLVREALAGASARVLRRGKGGEHSVVEEVGERAMAHVVEQARDPERLDDEALGREGLVRRERRQGAPQRGQQRARPQPRLVHHAEAVREPRVLRGREDPARALELADPAQPLEPRGIEEVVLGGVLVGQAGRARLGAGQPLRQLEVAVDRVADEVDGGEGVARHRLRIRARGRRSGDSLGGPQPARTPAAQVEWFPDRYATPIPTRR